VLFAAVSFSRARSGAPLNRRLFRVEDADPAQSFSDLAAAFTEPVPTSDALTVTRGHARPASVPTDALSVGLSSEEESHWD